MNRLRAAFENLRASGRKTLVPYVTAGYPDVETTLAILRGIDADRCACVELGVPFSDPIADGPVIQTSFARALERGFRLSAFLDALAGARGTIRVPLAAMVSYSIVYRHGVERFVDEVSAAGIEGLIVPDLSVEEAVELAAAVRVRDCCLAMIVAPTTPPDRCRRISALSEPFIYYQALKGVTGERKNLPGGLAEAVGRLRESAGKPVCVGFGISLPEHVADVCRVADGAIVGSAIVRRMNEAVDRSAAGVEIAGEVCDFVKNLSSGIR